MTTRPKKLGGKSHRRLTDLLLDVREGIEQSVRSRVEHEKIPVDAENAAGLTALFYAVRGQRRKIVEYLIQRRANVNPPLPRQPSLIEMAQSLPNECIMQLLSEAGSVPKSPEVLSRERETLPRWPTMILFKASEYPLYEAAINDDQSSLAEIASGISQKRLQVLLSEACLEHEVEFGLALIRGIDKIDYTREDAENPLFVAAECGCLPLVKALHEAGAKKCLLEAFEHAIGGGHADVVQYLIELVSASARKRATLPGGTTFEEMVHRNASRAARLGHTRVAESLLPFCSSRIAGQISQQIRQWRDEHDDDAPADRFFGYRGEATDPFS